MNELLRKVFFMLVPISAIYRFMKGSYALHNKLPGSLQRVPTFQSFRAEAERCVSKAWTGNSYNSVPTLSQSLHIASRTHYRKARCRLYMSDGINSARINTITSSQSSTMKRINNLLHKRKNRVEYGETVVEGPRIIFDLLRNKQTRNLIETIVVDEDRAQEYIPEIELYSDTASFDILFATKQVLVACSDTVTPQGIVAITKIPCFEQRTPSEGENTQAPIFLVLDGVSDPGNTGTLIRTAVATGVSAIFLLPGCCDIWNPKAVRSAMSASFLVPSFAVESWDEAVDQLHKLGVATIWAATMVHPYVRNDNTSCDDLDETLIMEHHRASLSYYEVNWREAPSALVIGNEGAGLSKPIRDCLETGGKMGVSSDRGSINVRAVHLPMCPGIESLNAAICGSVMLFEYHRQYQQQGKKT